MDLEIKNAVIRDVMLGREDHGILTSYVYLDYAGSGQGFGGYALDEYDKAEGKRVETKACSLWVNRLLEVVGVDTWDDLVGKSVRVKADYEHVEALGNFLNDEWFEPVKEMKELWESENNV